MSSVNKVIIVGNLGKDPETRQFNNGGSVTNLAVATSERWTDKQSGEKREATEWHKVALFNRLGEIAAQYLRKGSKVYIEGSIRTHKYQDQNGQDRYSTEIRANELVMLDSAGSNQSAGNNQGMGGGGAYNNPNAPQNTYQNQNNQNTFGQQPNNQPAQQGGYTQGNQGNQGMSNQGGAPNQSNSFNNNANTFNQPNQFNKPAQSSAPSKPTAMSDAPVDDDIPF